jgi:hypothetical protein
MDKQQAAEAYANNWKSGSTSVDVAIASFKSGADWHAHQFSSDALDFAIWLRESVLEWPERKMRYKGKMRTLGELYKLFNPSGAAAQTEKKYPIGGYAPGNYSCKCATCGNEFRGDKRAVQCEPCAIEMTSIPYTVLHEIAKGPQNDEIAFQWMLRVKDMAQKALADSPSMPAQQAAGLVWVKASEHLPETEKQISFKVTIGSDIYYHGGYVQNGAFKTNHGYGYSYTALENIEWLDESGQQVFTREQAEALQMENKQLKELISALESNLAAYRHAEDTRDDS